MHYDSIYYVGAVVFVARIYTQRRKASCADGSLYQRQQADIERGVLNICPAASSLDVEVEIVIRSLLGVRLADNIQAGGWANFDVKARMEEKERRSGWVNLGFALSVGTKPSIVKFEVEGSALLKGKNSDIEKMLEVDPETQIPLVFNSVYQQVFMSMYLLATLMSTPYPPANLLPTHQQQMPAALSGDSIQPSPVPLSQANNRGSSAEPASNEAAQGDVGGEGFRVPQSTAPVETPADIQHTEMSESKR